MTPKGGDRGRNELASPKIVKLWIKLPKQIYCPKQHVYSIRTFIKLEDIDLEYHFTSWRSHEGPYNWIQCPFNSTRQCTNGHENVWLHPEGPRTLLSLGTFYIRKRTPSEEKYYSCYTPLEHSSVDIRSSETLVEIAVQISFCANCSCSGSSDCAWRILMKKKLLTVFDKLNFIP